MKWTTLILLLALVISGQAKENVVTSEQAASEFATQLGLTDSQKQEAKQILQDGMDKRQQILKRHNIDLDSNQRPNLGRRELRSLKSDMTSLRKETEKRLSSVLDSNQMKEFRKLRDAKAKEFRNQLRSRLR